MEMTKLDRAFLVFTLALSFGACAKPVKPAPAIKVAERQPTVRHLTQTESERWKLAELVELNDALEPLWRQTVLQRRDRERACKDALELDEVASDLSRAELPKPLRPMQIDFDARVGELRAAIIIFAAECQRQSERSLAESFAPIPSAFDAVKQVVGVDETPQVSARLARPSSTPSGGR